MQGNTSKSCIQSLHMDTLQPSWACVTMSSDHCCLAGETRTIVSIRDQNSRALLYHCRRQSELEITSIHRTWKREIMSPWPELQLRTRLTRHVSIVSSPNVYKFRGTSGPASPHATMLVSLVGQSWCSTVRPPVLSREKIPRWCHLSLQGSSFQICRDGGSPLVHCRHSAPSSSPDFPVMILHVDNPFIDEFQWLVEH